MRIIPYSKNLTVGFDLGLAGNNLGSITASVLENYDSGFSRDFSFDLISEDANRRRSLIGGAFIGYKGKIHLHLRYEDFYAEYPQITVGMQTFYTYLTYTF